MIYIYDDDDVSHPMLWSIAMVHTKRILKLLTLKSFKNNNSVLVGWFPP